MIESRADRPRAITLGAVAELGNSNIFMAKDGVVYTPAPNGAFLNGITRQRVINLLRSDGVTVIETTLHYSDFENADGIFSSGNFAKVAPVIRIDGRNYSMALTIPRRGNSIGNLLWHSYARSFAPIFAIACSRIPDSLSAGRLASGSILRWMMAGSSDASAAWKAAGNSEVCWTVTPKPPKARA
jgi:hypothetical protein